MQRKTVVVAIASLMALLFIAICYNPWSRVQFFQAFGWGEWVYQRLTTVGEKVAIINSHYNPGGQQMAMFTGSYSSFGPFYGGKEMIWCISDQPFVLKAALEGYAPEDGVPLERLDANTLVFNSREYPITLTFTRTEPSSKDAALGYDLISFFVHASRTR